MQIYSVVSWKLLFIFSRLLYFAIASRECAAFGHLGGDEAQLSQAPKIAGHHVWFGRLNLPGKAIISHD